LIRQPNWLIVAYAFNIFILVPVCYHMLIGCGVARVFEHKVPDSAGLRILVGSLWLAILVASLAGLRWPAFFAPVLPIQIFYKGVWLLAFILPLMRASKPIPVGISVVFALIVVAYPCLLWAATR
jgi:hypothetical protein